jgi:hypothetical protein
MGMMVTGLAVSSGNLMATASATSNGWEPTHDRYTEVTHDTCGVAGLTVRLVERDNGRERWTPRGRDRLPYYMSHDTVTDVFTNLATDESVTQVSLANFNTLLVTDNGDGTLTLSGQQVSKSVMYAEDGTAIAHYTDQLRVELLINDASTPRDPSDDEIISAHLTRLARHGDDFCTALVNEIG